MNTIGTVLSGILTGFVFLPVLGLQMTINLLGMGGTWAGTIVLLSFLPSKHKAAGGVLVGAVMATLLAMYIPWDLFQRQFVTYESTEQVAVVEGVTTTVSVHKAEDDALWLCTSGIQVAGDKAKSVQRMLGHLPVLLHPNPKSVLSVGFGSGETSLCLSMHDIQRIDCVEISPELVYTALEHFWHINLGGELSEHVNMVYMDARNYLHLTDESYDVIINDSINPKYFADNASLYTYEYFTCAQSRLNDEGIFACWVPFNLPVSCFNSILGTFVRVFPYTTMWFPSTRPDHFVLLVGSAHAQKFNLADITKRINTSPVMESLAGIHIRSSFDLFSCYMSDTPALKTYLRQYTLNTDNRPFVEFSTDPALVQQEKWDFFNRLSEAARRPSAPDHIDWAGISSEEQDLWKEDFAALYRITSTAIKANTAYNRSAEVVQEIAESGGLEALFNDLTLYLNNHPDYISGLALRGTLLTRNSKYDEAIADLTRTIQLDPENAFAFNNRGVAYMNTGRLDTAIMDLKKAIHIRPEYVKAFTNLGHAYLKKNEFTKAIEACNKALKLSPDNPSALNNRGMARFQMEYFDEALSDFNASLDKNPASIDTRYNRVITCLALHNYKQAIDDCTILIKGNPKDGQAFEARALAYFHSGAIEKARQDAQRAVSLGIILDKRFEQQLNQK
jgi:spermidine synthase/Flp pilus assembly protein TadD